MTTHSDRPGRPSRFHSLAGAPSTLRDAWIADGAAVAVSIALAVMIDVGASGVVRVVLALAFVCYVPGRAVIANWPSAQARSQVALPVVLSVSIVTLVSVIGLWMHAWSPLAQFRLEAAASVAAITFAMLWRARSGRRPSPTRRPTRGRSR